MKIGSMFSYSLPLVGAAMMFSLPSLSTPDADGEKPQRTQEDRLPKDAVMPSEQPNSAYKENYYSNTNSNNESNDKEFEVVDEDRNDKITYTEMQKADAVTDIQEFRTLDRDESGDLDRREFTSVNHSKSTKQRMR